MQPMAEQTIALPFTIPNLVGGFATGTGLAKASPSEVTLELLVKDDFLEILKSRVKEIHIPRSEIDAVRLKRGWFGATLNLRVKSMKLLEDLPGSDGGEVTLHIARRNRGTAAEFVNVLSRP
jgi:hypothetical protein